MAGFVGQPLRRDVGPVAQLAGPILVAAEVQADGVDLGVEVEHRERDGEFRRPAGRRALRRHFPLALEGGGPSPGDRVGLRAPGRHREARDRAVGVARVELDRNPVVDTGRGVAGELCRPHLLRPGVETGERHVERRVVVEHDHPRLVGGRLAPLRHPEALGGGAVLPGRLDQPAVDRRCVGDALRLDTRVWPAGGSAAGACACAAVAQGHTNNASANHGLEDRERTIEFASLMV